MDGGFNNSPIITNFANSCYFNSTAAPYAYKYESYIDIRADIWCQ